MKEKRPQKKKVVMPSYDERIRAYNREKQVALLGCETQEQVERVVKTLREKWNV